MNKRTIVKILSIALTVIMIAMCLQNVVFATDLLDPNTIQGSKTNTSNSFNTAINMILGVVQVIGIGVAVIMLIVLAIKYISAAPGDKAEIKKHAVVYVVGAVVLFAATGILQIIKTFATNAFKA